MYLRKKERRSCTKVYSAGARGLPRAKSQDPCPTDPTTPKARFLFAIGILKDGPCCWLRASRSFPTKLQDEPRLGLRLAPEILVFWNATICHLSCSFTTINVGRVS